MVAEQQRIVNVIRDIIDTQVESGARIDYRYGIVEGYDVDGENEVDVFLGGDLDDDTDLPQSTGQIRVPAAVHLNAGDYVMVAMTQEGDYWIEQVLPYSLYSKLAIDPRGSIVTGDGESPPANYGTAGQVLLSGGAYQPVSWGTVSGEGGGGSAYWNTYTYTFTGNVNNLPTASYASPALVSMNPDGVSRFLFGMVARENGFILAIRNTAPSSAIVIDWESENANATAANRFTGSHHDSMIYDGETQIFMYVASLSRWIAMTGHGNSAETSDISTQAFGDVADKGANDREFAGAGHIHGMPANPVTAHVADGDPHPVYATDADLSTHAAAANPHPTYATALTTHAESNHSIGFQPFAYHADAANLADGSTYGHAVNEARAFPLYLHAPMKVQSLTIISGDTTLARTAEFRIYVDSGSNTFDFITGTNGTFSFTPSAISQRTANIATPGTIVGPGVVWLVLRNTHGSNTFGVRRVVVSSVWSVGVTGLATGQGALGSTINFTNYSSRTGFVYALRLDGRVGAEASAF
jgi:hypothetical protein